MVVREAYRHNKEDIKNYSDLCKLVPEVPYPFVNWVMRKESFDISYHGTGVIPMEWEELTDGQREALLIWSQMPSVTDEELYRALSDRYADPTSPAGVVNRYGWVFSIPEFNPPIEAGDYIEVYWRASGESESRQRYIRLWGHDNVGYNSGRALDSLVKQAHRKEKHVHSSESESEETAEKPLATAFPSLTDSGITTPDSGKESHSGKTEPSVEVSGDDRNVIRIESDGETSGLVPDYDAELEGIRNQLDALEAAVTKRNQFAEGEAEFTVRLSREEFLTLVREGPEEIVNKALDQL